MVGELHKKIGREYLKQSREEWHSWECTNCNNTGATKILCPRCNHEVKMV